MLINNLSSSGSIDMLSVYTELGGLRAMRVARGEMDTVDCLIMLAVVRDELTRDDHITEVPVPAPLVDVAQALHIAKNSAATATLLADLLGAQCTGGTVPSAELLADLTDILDEGPVDG